MLNTWSAFRLASGAFHSARALHTRLIEAKKLAYADLLRYVGDPRFGQMRSFASAIRGAPLSLRRCGPPFFRMSEGSARDRIRGKVSWI